MSATQLNQPTAQFATLSLRDWLALLAALRNFNQPIDSPEGLRQAIAIAVQLGQTLGIDPALLGKLRAALENPAVFDLLLAVDRFLLSLLIAKAKSSPNSGDQPTNGIRAQALGPHEWLAMFVELLRLLSQLKNAA